jgi:anti-sigma B factor antagonist
MKMKTEQNGSISIVRVDETRMMYPMLAEFSGTVSALVSGGARQILIDLGTVTYVDSATIGCFMDLYRTISGVGGSVKISGVQKRVETMLTMTGAQNFIPLFTDEGAALQSFGA